MLSAPRYRLTQLFAVTASVAVLAYGIYVVQQDTQTGIMIALAGAAITLSLLFLRVARAAWIGMAIGFAMSAIWYWWSDKFNQTEPADRLFEFVVSAIWFSVVSGAGALTAYTFFRASGKSHDSPN